MKKKKKREEGELKQIAEDEENSYENKYSLKNAHHNKNHSDLCQKYVFEATPDGVVILNYDTETKSFTYWSDYTISYKYLQAVARRFVLITIAKIIIFSAMKRMKRTTVAQILTKTPINKHAKKIHGVFVIAQTANYHLLYHPQLQIK